MVSLTRQPGFCELSVMGLEGSPDRRPKELHPGMPKSQPVSMAGIQPTTNSGRLLSTESTKQKDSRLYTYKARPASEGALRTEFPNSVLGKPELMGLGNKGPNTVPTITQCPTFHTVIKGDGEPITGVYRC